MAAIFPTTLTYVEQRIPLSGQITSFFFVGASLGGMTLPWLIGQLIEPAGPKVVMYTILLDLALALIVYSFISLQNTRPRVVHPIEFQPSSSEESE
jgi:fucose permease